MKNLYFIRHAKSSWEFDIEDHKRPLNVRGQKDAELVGRQLKNLIKSIDKVLCSDAYRARETAEIILEHLEIDPNIFSLEPKLYDFAGHQVLDVIKSTSSEIDTLVIFGHNHALTSLANNLGDQLIDNVPTSSVVGISFDTDSWDSIKEGKNLLFLTPKQLK